MALKIRCQDLLNRTVAEALELRLVKACQGVEVRVGEEQVPGGRSVRVLQYGPVVLKHLLAKQRVVNLFFCSLFSTLYWSYVSS